MKIKFNSIPVYRMWREGTSKKAGSKGRPGSKLAKKMRREIIKRTFRTESITENAGKAERRLGKNVLIGIDGNPVQYLSLGRR